MRVARVFEDGYRTAIVGDAGRKLTPVMLMSSTGGVVLRKIPNRDADKAPAVLYKGRDYPVRRAEKIFRRAAKRGPLSKAAKLFLRSIGSK